MSAATCAPLLAIWTLVGVICGAWLMVITDSDTDTTHEH